MLMNDDLDAMDVMEVLEAMNAFSDQMNYTPEGIESEPQSSDDYLLTIMMTMLDNENTAHCRPSYHPFVSSTSCGSPEQGDGSAIDMKCVILHTAAYLGYEAPVRKLLDTVMVVGDARIGSAFVDAVLNGHTCIVDMLVDHGADVNMSDGIALSSASRSGYYQIVRKLLDFGADVHLNNDAALVNAVFNSHVSIVGMLLDHGAHVDVMDGLLTTYASRLSDLTMANLLSKYVPSNVSSSSGDDTLRRQYHQGTPDRTMCV